MTTASLEVLACIAFRQPISQAEIDQLFDADKRGLVVKLRDLKLVEEFAGTDGRLRFLNRFPLGGTGGNSIYSTVSYSDGVWHHAAITKSAAEMTLYVDGQQAGKMADTGVFGAADALGVALVGKLALIMPVSTSTEGR